MGLVGGGDLRTAGGRGFRSGAGLLLCLGLIGCVGRRPSLAGDVDSAGVVISNLGLRKTPAPFGVVGVPEFNAGDPDGPANLMPFEGNLAADSAGRVYVHDVVQRQVVVLDTLGRMIGVRGKSGGGPGE